MTNSKQIHDKFCRKLSGKYQLGDMLAIFATRSVTHLHYQSKNTRNIQTGFVIIQSYYDVCVLAKGNIKSRSLEFNILRLEEDILTVIIFKSANVRQA